MPSLPVLDVVGLIAFFSLVLVALGVFWGINKAIITAKRG